MAIRTVTRTKVHSASPENLVTEAAAKVLPNLRAVQVRRIRRGQKPVELPEELEVQPEENEEAGDVADELAGEVLRIAAKDADGRARRYEVALLGDGLKKRPELATVQFDLEAADEPAATRESEIVRAMGALTSWAEGVAKNHLDLMKTVNGAIGGLTTAVADVATKQGGKVAEVEAARIEFEREVFRAERDVRLEIEQLQARGRRSDRMWNSLDAMFARFDPIIEAFADRSPDAGKPTDEELARLFAREPDLLELARAFVGATDEAVRANLRTELIKRWAATEDETKAEIAEVLRSLGEKRGMQILKWMHGVGFK